MPPIKFQLNPIYLSGTDAFQYFQNGHHGGHLGYWNRMILAIHYSKSPCHPNASHQVWAQSDLGFTSRCGLKIFKMAIMAAIFDIRRNNFSNSSFLCRFDASHQVSAQSDLRFGRRYHLKNFKMANMAAILDIEME